MTIDAETIKTLGQVAGWGVGLGALITALRTNRKITKSKAEDEDVRAGAAQKIVDASTAAVELLHAEAEKAKDKLKTEQEESRKWKDTCDTLEDKVDDLSKRLDDNEACQSELTGKLARLELEKMSLKGRISDLEIRLETANERITALQDENKRLKEEREIEKQVIS